MECVLQSLNWRIALIYLDDVLVYSRTFSDHLDHLCLVFDRFREAGLKLKPKKCHFGQKSVKFLGHVISKDGVQPDPDKIKAIKEYPVPRRVKDVRAFLGLANYYRKFVRDFSKIAGPLHDLTKKALKFRWTDECQAAFERLKSALIQAPILAHPDFTLPFDLYVDASDEALGMVLGQVQNGREVVISYSGCKLLPAEKNYSVTEREALAVVAGIKYFQPYVYGVYGTVNSPLCTDAPSKAGNISQSERSYYRQLRSDWLMVFQLRNGGGKIALGEGWFVLSFDRHTMHWCGEDRVKSELG